MRGDSKVEAKKLIQDAATAAKLVLDEAEYKAEKKRYASTAIILGPDDEPLFHIVSTWWSRIVIIGYGVLLGIIVVMTILMYANKTQLDTLQHKVDEQIVPEGTQEQK